MDQEGGSSLTLPPTPGQPSQSPWPALGEKYPLTQACYKKWLCPSDHTAASPSRKRPFLFHMQRSGFITEKKKSLSSQENQDRPREKPSSEERPKMSCPKGRGSLHCPLEWGPAVWVPVRSLPRKGHSELGTGCLGDSRRAVPWPAHSNCPFAAAEPASAQHSVLARASASPLLSIRTGLQSCSWLRVPADAFRYTLEQLPTETAARGIARRSAPSPPPPPPGAPIQRAPAHTSPGICARRKGTEAAAGKAASG